MQTYAEADPRQGSRINLQTHAGADPRQGSRTDMQTHHVGRQRGSNVLWFIYLLTYFLANCLTYLLLWE